MARLSGANEGLKIIEKAIEEVKRQGFAVGYRDGKLCVENTIGCHHTFDYDNPFNSAKLEEKDLDEIYPKLDKNATYFIRMTPLHRIPIIGWGMKCSDDEEKWVECKIIPENFGKVRAIALDTTYGSEKYYVQDFESLLRSGHIVKKTSNNQKVKKIKWIEPIPNTSLYYEHEAWVLVNDVLGGESI